MDAGFVAGDEVSSHYDPMIAKLIVRGSTRETAIRKLHAALNEYEVAGPITNIEFLKRICQTPAFVAGDVETGLIAKHKAELFSRTQIDLEVYAQAAIGTLIQESIFWQRRPNENTLGFTSSFQNRTFSFTPHYPDGDFDSSSIDVEVKELGRDLFDVSVEGVKFHHIKSMWNSTSAVLVSFFGHTRLESRLIADEGRVTIFQQGEQYRLQLATPKWIEKALGVKDIANSVLAPMPCKILRVEVKEGDRVTKNQVLVVIESMKMETTIRSPQDGVVSKVVHKEGGLCKAGTALVEFKDSETS